ncbi:hypothetical protein [Intestinibacter bartlettii]|uniref:hypothetical protein n=1 Tax=Intestinibacter bartlettii TaxID=261299 RepID=UPI002900F848|nr:hypothetical protein [Intestinibacter bartlettii]MDU2162161.1 hypothetical protein [Intestinibacter bartlettii]
MSSIEMFEKQREKVLEEIKKIEKLEGVENESNSLEMSELNLEKAKVNSQINELSKKLTKLRLELDGINQKINDLSGSAIDKILDAIKGQRWYFFKNKPKVLMDKNTALLWANLDYFPYYKENGNCYNSSECSELINNLNIDGFEDWKVPTNYELWDMIEDKTFPFQGGDCWEIKNYYPWFVYYNNQINAKDLDYEGSNSGIVNYDACLLPCNDSITYDDYKNNVSENNPVYTENERLQFTLNLFINNNLWPIFDDENITELYKKIYFEKPRLLEELAEIQSQIDTIEEQNKNKIKLLSSEFDYTKLLVNYNIYEINNSIIKYYKAVISWVDGLIERLDYFQEQKSDMIEEFNKIGLKLSQKYQENQNLNQRENDLLKERQKFFKKNFELGINDVTKKLLSYKKQAQDIEDRIDDINEGNNGISELAELENEKRASFLFIAENTANIVKNALIKMDYFEKNKDFAVAAINLWDKWSMDYKVLKTTYKEDLKNNCEKEEIEEEVWMKWFEDWCNTRFVIEQQFMPLIKEGLSGNFEAEKKGVVIIEDIVALLDEYKKKVDNFYKNDRSAIYVNYVFVANGELQEKFETELKLYKISSEFQKKLQDIIFSLEKNENKIFLINWANNLIDLPVDEIINFVQLNNLDSIPQNVLNQFIELKKKNFESYLSDAKAYGKEQERRDKEFNSLIFKMRKGLAKNKQGQLAH